MLLSFPLSLRVSPSPSSGGACQAQVRVEDAHALRACHNRTHYRQRGSESIRVNQSQSESIRVTVASQPRCPLCHVARHVLNPVFRCGAVRGASHSPRHLIVPHTPVFRRAASRARPGCSLAVAVTVTARPARKNMTPHGTSRHVTARHGASRHHITSRHGTARHGTATESATRKHVTTQHVTARHGTARHITTQHIKNGTSRHATATL